jgi:hypothetical protein
MMEMMEMFGLPMCPEGKGGVYLLDEYLRDGSVISCKLQRSHQGIEVTKYASNSVKNMFLDYISVGHLIVKPVTWGCQFP